MNPQLDPEAQALLDVMRALESVPLQTLSVEDARERMRASLITKGRQVEIPSINDLRISTPAGPLRLRLYRPRDGTLPMALFLHGGGWVLNDLDTHDDLCRHLAKRSGWLLASLDFRRAPEHKHPAALEDAYLAYRWLLDNADVIGCEASCCALVGESSGAATAAALTLLLRHVGAPLPAYQALAYPLTDCFGRWPSYAERGVGYTLDCKLLRWFFMHNGFPVNSRAPDPCPADQYLFPLLAEDLSGLPPALVMTAEFDPLRDEGIAYVRRLTKAGVAVTHIHADDQMHGFLLHRRAVGRANELVNHLADSLTCHHVGSPS